MRGQQAASGNGAAPPAGVLTIEELQKLLRRGSTITYGAGGLDAQLIQGAAGQSLLPTQADGLTKTGPFIWQVCERERQRETERERDRERQTERKSE